MPYGGRSVDTIKKYALQDEKFLLSHDVKLIVAACGTVSSVASDLAEDLPVPYFEVVSHAAKSAVEATKNGKIGVIGTNATIKSGKHAEYIKQLMPTADVTACSGPLFVPLVEEGWHSPDDIVVLETVKRYLKPIIDAGSDTLILGCTHYPVLRDAISKVVGDNVTLIDAGTATAMAVKEFMKNEDMLNQYSEDATHKFFVSDKPETFTRIASDLLGKSIDDKSVEQVDLSSL